MSAERLIARRYIFSKRRHPFVGIIGTISILGIAVGVAALITTLAVMNGFDSDLKERIIGLHAHVSVEKDPLLTGHAALTAKLAALPGAVGAAPYVEGQALLQSGDWGTGVLVRGLDPKAEEKVSRFGRHVSRGALTDAPDGAVLGLELAKRAGLVMGSEFKILTQKQDKPRTFRVEGIFSSGMYEYDANLLFLNLANAQSLYGMGEAVTGVSVALDDPDRADAFKKSLAPKLSGFRVRTWMDMNRMLFAALKLEKVVMFLILALIILVACLNIAGSLTILVMDKTKDMGVLKALGASPGALVRIFVYDGLFIGVAGAAAGLAVGSTLCWALDRYPLLELPKEIYYVNRIPVRMDLQDTFLVVATAIVLSLVSAFYPAWMAGRLDPVRALRYE